MSDHVELQHRAYLADERLSNELHRVYGDRARECRYWPIERHTDPKLIASIHRKHAADKAYLEAVLPPRSTLAQGGSHG